MTKLYKIFLFKLLKFTFGYTPWVFFGQFLLKCPRSLHMKQLANFVPPASLKNALIMIWQGPSNIEWQVTKWTHLHMQVSTRQMPKENSTFQFLVGPAWQCGWNTKCFSAAKADVGAFGNWFLKAILARESFIYGEASNLMLLQRAVCENRGSCFLFNEKLQSCLKSSTKNN